MNFSPSNPSSAFVRIRQKVITSRLDTLALVLIIAVPILTLCVVILTIALLIRLNTTTADSVDSLITKNPERDLDKSPPEPQPPSSVGQPEKQDDALHVIISAALAAVINKPHRVISIVPAMTARNWSIEGRRSHHSSHQIR